MRAIAVFLSLICSHAFAEIPNIPSDTTVVSEGPGKALVQWKDNSNNESVFDIQRKIGDREWFGRASVSRNVTSYRDPDAPTNRIVRYRVRARRGSKYSEFSEEAILMPENSTIDISARWDFIDSLAVPILSNATKYLSADVGKPLRITLELGTKFRSQAFTTVSATLPDTYEVSFLVNLNEQNELLASYPSQMIPFRVWYEVERSPGYPVLAHQGEGQMFLRQKQDNYTHRIAFFQVVEPGVDLRSLNFCLMKDSALGGDGYVPIGNVVPDCAAKWDWGSNAATITTRSYPAMDFLFGGAEKVEISDVTSLSNQRERKAGSVPIFSLRHLGAYWEKLLYAQGLQSTARLGRNPKFEIEILPVVVAANTLKSNDHATVKAFFANVAKGAGVDLSSFDFVIHAIYNVKGYGANEFVRSFAAGRKSYCALELSSEKIVHNELFLTVAHEMGHQLFSLPDRYDGFGVKYPSGVPSPDVFPHPLACLMAKGFAWELATPTVARTYDTKNYTDTLQSAGLGRFHTSDPRHQVLCPEDVAKISTGN